MMICVFGFRVRSKFDAGDSSENSRLGFEFLRSFPIQQDILKLDLKMSLLKSCTMS